MLKAFPRQNQSHSGGDLRSLRSPAEHQRDQAPYNTPQAAAEHHEHCPTEPTRILLLPDLLGSPPHFP